MPPPRSARLLLALLLVPLLAGCEEDIVLVDPSDHPFSLYGVLDPSADTQYVFVFPVEGTLEPATDAPLAADVATRALPDGAPTAWRDSVVFHPTGGYGHVFWTTEPVLYGARYRLEAVRTDGEASVVEVRVPPRLSPRTARYDAARPVAQTILLDGDADVLTRPTLELQVRTLVAMLDPVTPIFEYRTLLLPLGGGDLRRTADGWRVELDLAELYETAHADMATRVDAAPLAQHGVEFLLLRLRLIVADAGWVPPEGGWDPEVLVHPEALRNVQNGFGFVTAGYRVEHAWRPPGTALAAAGFAAP